MRGEKKGRKGLWSDGKSNLEEVVSIDSEEDTTPKIGENEDTKEDITPKIGMEFDSEDEAYLYYNIYARYVGFSIRRDWLNRSKANKTTIISHKYSLGTAGFLHSALGTAGFLHWIAAACSVWAAVFLMQLHQLHSLNRLACVSDVESGNKYMCT
uniref:Protein FAR1-RELATED SEQUENCE n=1 Tax=Quercus lobata TaxID=97700 RepID=A0A7N2LFV5_QUELO